MHKAPTLPNDHSINSSNEFINNLFPTNHINHRSHPSSFSPIYSRNYKGIKHYDNEEEEADLNLETDSTLNSFHGMEDDEMMMGVVEGDEEEVTLKLANPTSDYMYLLNATNESQQD